MSTDPSSTPAAPQAGKNPSVEQAVRNTQHAQKHQSRLREMFHAFSQVTSAAVGSAWAFVIAGLVVIIWAITGPLFHFSDTWQLVINTGTTIVTFLMVFLIQNTQNRDAKAIHLKLDELIRSKKGARNTLVDLENCTDEELDHIEQEFHRLRKRADHHTERKGQPDTAVRKSAAASEKSV